MSIYLEDNELKDAYDTASVVAQKYFEPFDEYERLASNRIRKDIPKHFPRVNDGTLAAFLPEVAKRVFDELYTGRFTSLDRDEAWLIELINILWNRVIIPGAETDADFYTKMWNLHYRAEQHGAASAFQFFTESDNYTGADMTVDYIRDIYLEPYKKSDLASRYIWRLAYFSKLDLKRIIANAEKEDGLAKSEKRSSNSQWDIKELKAFVNGGPSDKDAKNKNLSEREKQLASSQFVIPTVYHRDFDAPFISITPDGKPLRRRKNENPTGDIPVTLLYHTQDLVNPYGRGLVEFAAPGQNVTDHMTQADVLATQKGIDPPIDIHGETEGLVLRSLVNAPGKKWFTGQASVKPVDQNTSVYGHIQQRLGMYRGSVQNFLGAFDNSISADAGNAMFSRTPAGVARNEGRTNVNDNFFGKSGRTAYRRIARNMMNIHMANMQGEEIFDMLEDEIERLEKGGWKFNGGSKARLEYDKLRGKFDFETDDQRKASDPEKEGLLEGIKVLSDNNGVAVGYIERDGKFRVDLGEAYRQYFDKLKLSKSDKIIVPIDTVEQAGTDQTTTDDGQGDSAVDALSPEQILQQAQVIATQHNLPPESIESIAAALGSGYSQEQISTYLTQTDGGQS